MTSLKEQQQRFNGTVANLPSLLGGLHLKLRLLEIIEKLLLLERRGDEAPKKQILII